MMGRLKFLPVLVFITLIAWGESANSKILIISPHPDDDVLIAAGVTYASTQRSEQITVVYVTNGDFNGRASGDLRQDEAIDAQTGNLGTQESDLIFLGYPDGDLASMYSNYPLESDRFLGAANGQTATYAHRGLGGTDYHNYRFGAHANYNRFNLLMDLKDIIDSQRPDHIITVAEFDQHDDHRTTYQATRDAILAVTATDSSYVPVLNKSLIWSSDSGAWPNSSNPQSYFSEPVLTGTGLTWADRESLDVPLAMQVVNMTNNIKARAINAHVSQGGVTGFNNFLGRFIHKDEFFWPVNVNGGNAPPRVNAGLEQSVSQGATVQLNGSQSKDPDGSALAYQWRQVVGPHVSLQQANTATPSFTAPSGSPIDIPLVFELIVNDGSLDTLPDHVSVLVSSGATNIAQQATVRASSQNFDTTQLAIKAVDGIAEGAWNGDYTREWATINGRAGSWLELNWEAAYQVNRVVLYDRPNPDDQITTATLTFSDGSKVTTGALTNSGAGDVINFTPVTTNSIRMTATTVSGTTQNVGLAEIEVYGVSATGGNIAPVANAGPDQTVTAGDMVSLDGRGSQDPNGDSIVYRWTQSAGPTVNLTGANTSTPSFSAPSVTTSTVITFSLVVNDGNLNSAADTVNVTVAAASGPGTNIAQQATVSASSQNFDTAQLAIKAVDGKAEGAWNGDYTREWATINGRAGSWLELNWEAAYQVNRVVLYDRPNPDDQITTATLTFSDGSKVTTGALTNSGAGDVINFTPVTTNSIRMTATTVSGTTQNVGLAEIEVYGVSATGGNIAPVANAGPDQTVTAGDMVSLDGRGSQDPNGDSIVYRWTQSAGPTVNLTGANTSTPSFSAPSVTTPTVVTFSLVVNDGNLNSAADTVDITVNPTGNTAPTFVSGNTSLQVKKNSSVNLKPNLHVSDIDIGQTETWTKNVAPTHGTLTFSGATARSGSSNITPGGTISYRPASGYTGVDSFKVQVSDGIAIAIRSFTVTVK